MRADPAYGYRTLQRHEELARVLPAGPVSASVKKESPQTLTETLDGLRGNAKFKQLLNQLFKQNAEKSPAERVGLYVFASIEQRSTMQTLDLTHQSLFSPEHHLREQHRLRCMNLPGHMTDVNQVVVVFELLLTRDEDVVNTIAVFYDDNTYVVPDPDRTIRRLARKLGKSPEDISALITKIDHWSEEMRDPEAVRNLFATMAGAESLAAFNRDVIKQMHVCAACNAYGPDLAKCGRCRAIYYCNATCQKQHWATHKVECKK